MHNKYFCINIFAISRRAFPCMVKEVTSLNPLSESNASLRKISYAIKSNFQPAIVPISQNPSNSSIPSFIREERLPLLYCFPVIADTGASPPAHPCSQSPVPFSRFLRTASTSCFLCGVRRSYAAVFSSFKVNSHLLLKFRFFVPKVALKIEHFVQTIPFRNDDFGQSFTLSFILTSVLIKLGIIIRCILTFAQYNAIIITVEVFI